MPTPRAMFRNSPLHVCLCVLSIAFNYYSRLAHLFNDERFCISTVAIYFTYELQRFE